MKLRPFQMRAVKALESGKYDTVVLSLPRAQGKSTLASLLCLRALTPGDKLFQTGRESHLVAKTIGLARKTCFKVLRQMVEALENATDYKVSESANACHIRHKASNTRVSVVAGNGSATLGLVGCPMVVLDEPGALDTTAGQALWDSLSTALGKPESDLLLFVIGHLAPNATTAGHWYYDLVHKGTRGRTWVYFLQGRRDRWNKAAELRRCSPLSWHYAKSRAKLLEQRDEAVSDQSALSSFLSFRLNLPSADESTMLLTVTDWLKVCARPVPEPEGRPVVGLDIGGNRSWSAAVAAWPNGRIEALAVCPGDPSIEAQEKRDSVPRGTYQKLVDAGVLHVAEGLRIPTVRQLAGLVAPWYPRLVLADAWKFDELIDAKVKRLVLRRPLFKESTQDIRAVRRWALDGDMAVAEDSRQLLHVSLTAGCIKADDCGNVKFTKAGTDGKARDDVAQGMLFAVGGASRLRRKKGANFAVAPA